jgi:tRNA A37 threonylcarbamoyladenosine biosynthesis protein TsaE
MISLTAPHQTDTAGIAAAIAGLAKPGDMFVLIGEMGVGKTYFASQSLRQLLICYTTIRAVDFPCIMPTCIA